MYTGQSISPNKYFEIKEGSSVKLINEPDNYHQYLNGISSKLNFHSKLKQPVDLIHLFTKSKKELSVELPRLATFLKNEGAFWISWPREESNYVSDLNEDNIKEIAVHNGLTFKETGWIDEKWFLLKLTNKGNT